VHSALSVLRLWHCRGLNAGGISKVFIVMCIFQAILPKENLWALPEPLDLINTVLEMTCHRTADFPLKSTSSRRSLSSFHPIFLIETSTMSASSEPSTSHPRSSRARVKSQRALDSEFTDRLFTRAKDKPVNEAETSQVAKGNTKTKTKGKAPKKRGGKGKKQEVYCVCRSDGTDGRPMIECGECTDW